MESKSYNKLVNTTEKKQTHREQTSGSQWGGAEGRSRARVWVGGEGRGAVQG